jgi:hypothetical protein
MPRRGDHRREFSAVEDVVSPSERIGMRVVQAPDRTGALRAIVFDPNGFRCSMLAGELADEWVDYLHASQLSDAQAATYRRAVREFCAAVDSVLADAAARASLSSDEPDLASVLASWERRLPTSYRAGSTRPAVLASAVRALIARRAQHDQRPVDPGLLRLVTGELGVAWGARQELDEYSRTDRRALVRTAWARANELEHRLTAGWALAAQGRHPAEHGWTSPANLLWGLTQEQVSPRDIRDNLPPLAQWPPELSACPQRGDRPVNAARSTGLLLRWLVRQLYPHGLDLHAFRVLLVAATGHAPEEITTLTEADVEFLPAGVRLTLTKQRARRRYPRVFTDTAPSAAASPGSAAGDATDFADRPHHEVSTIIRRLMRVTEHTRGRAPDVDGRLFLKASVSGDYVLRFGRWDYNRRHAGFADWLVESDLSVTGAADIRRLRKSTKVEKALAFGGRIADAADDHHEQTFRGHYAQGTTLRVLSGRVITTAQEHWFDRAVEGPTVLTGNAAALLAEPDQLAALGLDRQQAEKLRQGALDMGVTHCRDPYDSPYSAQGELCAVAPLRCLECRNAWVLPSHLPQLLLFAEHLDRLRDRLTPQRFAAVWGQSYVNLQAVLAERTDQEKALARKHIDADQIGLHLPLAANVEFDG